MQALLRCLLSLAFFSTATTVATKHHKLLLISFDGFRYDYANEEPMFPAFQYLNANGVRAKYLQGAFPTLTSPSHMSIATGLYTESHNVVHNCHYNMSVGHQGSDFLSTLPVNYWWDTGVEPIWIAAVNQGLKSGGYMFPGSYATINGVSATKKVLQKQFMPYSQRSWQNRISTVVGWLKDEDMDFVALYFEEPDTLSHELGPDSKRVRYDVKSWVSNTIMHLLKKVEDAGLTDDLNIIFLSDHGHIPINTTVGHDDAVSLSKHINIDDIDFQFCNGPIGLIEPKPGRLVSVYQALKGQSNVRVYYKEEIPERWHLKGSDRIPSIIVVGEPGYFVFWKFPGYHPTRGDHGYDNKLVNMRAFYYSIGPSFKKNYVVDGFESVHIYPLMCHLLGIQPAPNNGSLDVLLKTLVSDTDVPSVTVYLAVLIIVCIAMYFVYCKTRKGAKGKHKGV
nr:ectonucleotide pyrophosphatase/phosphodiesterase family member 7 [Ciona intestinalis]|eukprot:XP_002129588.1 ectonucleotide pyrophosphatase/phosphodiesterase family member 7 [Ciona intestinalis]